jgi:hypothetical protein
MGGCKPGSRRNMKRVWVMLLCFSCFSSAKMTLIQRGVSSLDISATKAKPFLSSPASPHYASDASS